MRNAVGYPARTARHSAAAALLLAPEGVSDEPLASFIAVVEATVAGDVSLGVLPIENSLHGPVGETHDLLYEAPLSIVSEVTLPIVHCVLAKSPLALADVTTLRSYPVAFDQCRDLIHSLDVRCLPSATTADAAREVSESADPHEAAIASVEAARLYGLHVIADDVGDRPPRSPASSGSASTPGSTSRRAAEPRSRSSPTIVPERSSGALQPFARHGLNLVQLVSRPIPHSTFRYRFDLVLDGHPLDHEVQTALVEMREWTREVRIFGSYAATGEH